MAVPSQPSTHWDLAPHQSPGYSREERHTKKSPAPSCECGTPRDRTKRFDSLTIIKPTTTLHQTSLLLLPSPIPSPTSFSLWTTFFPPSSTLDTGWRYDKSHHYSLRHENRYIIVSMVVAMANNGYVLQFLVLSATLHSSDQVNVNIQNQNSSHSTPQLCHIQTCLPTISNQNFGSLCL